MRWHRRLRATFHGLGGALLLAGCASSPPVAGPATSGGVVVARGDTLSVIGTRLGLPWREIAQVNGIGAPWTIVPGQTLRLPVRRAAPVGGAVAAGRLVPRNPGQEVARPSAPADRPVPEATADPPRQEAAPLVAGPGGAGPGAAEAASVMAETAAPLDAGGGRDPGAGARTGSSLGVAVVRPERLAEAAPQPGPPAPAPGPEKPGAVVSALPPYPLPPAPPEGGVAGPVAEPPPLALPMPPAPPSDGGPTAPVEARTMPAREPAEPVRRPVVLRGGSAPRLVWPVEGSVLTGFGPGSL